MRIRAAMVKPALAVAFVVASLTSVGNAAALTNAAGPSPQSSAAPPIPTLSAIAGAPQAGPAPRLEMNEFRDRAYDPNARGSVSLRVLFATKAMGNVFFSTQRVLVIPDNAYGRWIVASFEDVFLGRLRSYAEDPAVDRCCLRSANTDEQGNVRFANLRPGAYIAFGGYVAQTGNSVDRFVSYGALDQNGNPTTASIPTLVFTDTIYEALVMVVPFTITPAMPDVTLQPVADFDGVYR